MSRTSRVRALAFTVLLAAAGCQDYNFQPVKSCVRAYGQEHVKLSDVSSADVLFVVDDSGSMRGEQEALAAQFQQFADALSTTNNERVVAGQTPIDFHLAVTTTSVFENQRLNSDPHCRTDCPGAVGEKICCDYSGSSPSQPMLAVHKCSGPGDGSCGSGYSCSADCVQYRGEFVCCGAKGPEISQKVSCDTVGDACGKLVTHYEETTSCWMPPDSSAKDEYPFPQGDFFQGTYNGKSRSVLHYDKSLYENCATPPCAKVNRDGDSVDTLNNYFKANVQVGTCGSNEEQGLAAARLSLQKELARAPADRQFLGDNSKLVLVFIGDEDDCSSPQDASKGIVLRGEPGDDSCVADTSLDPDKQKETSVDELVEFFTKLPNDPMAERPVGAAFIVSARGSDGKNLCQDASCVADICCDTACTGDVDVCTSIECGGQGKGTRFLDAAAKLRAKGADVVAGSICDSNWGAQLKRIAEIVKPPVGLVLKADPAAAEVVQVRIASGSKTRKTCYGPAPLGTSLADAVANYDWWFTATRDQATDAQKAPAAVTRYVFINHDRGQCEASPGETYFANFVAQVTGACTGATAAEADENCVAMLGGRSGDWTCFAGVTSSGACIAPVGGVSGTCLCGPRGDPAAPTEEDICPNG